MVVFAAKWSLATATATTAGGEGWVGFVEMSMVCSTRGGFGCCVVSAWVLCMGDDWRGGCGHGKRDGPGWVRGMRRDQT